VTKNVWPIIRRRCFVLLTLALLVALVPLTPAQAQSDQSGRRVQDLNLYFWDISAGLQPGDYLKWEAPWQDWDSIADYTVQGRYRFDAGWSEWRDLATMAHSADPIVYDITTWQPTCTDWAYRVRANYDDGTSGPWSSVVSRLTPRRAPSRPHLDGSHSKTADLTDANSVQQLTVTWPLAYCQTDYEVWVRDRRSGRLDNIHLKWSPWRQVEGAGMGDAEDIATPSEDGSTRTRYTTTHDFTSRRGVGFQIAVRVRNLKGWSGWSDVVWTRGFRVTCSDCGWHPVTRADVS